MAAGPGGTETSVYRKEEKGVIHVWGEEEHFKQKEQLLQRPQGRECSVFMGQLSSSVREGMRLPVVGGGVTQTVF